MAVLVKKFFSDNAKGKTSFLALSLVSVAAGAVSGVFINTLATRYILTNPASPSDVLFAATIISSTLLALVFLLTGLLVGRISAERRHEDDLKNLKEYTDMLHRSVSEAEVYEILHKFVGKMPQVNCVNLFYTNDRSGNDNSWIKVADEKLPLCGIPHKNCLVAKYGQECRVRNIQKDIPCSHQLSDYKFGSYVCLPILDSGGLLGILQAYSRRNYAFDEITISKIKSYIEMAKPVLNSRKALNILNKKASTDKLTKLYNRNFLEPYLENQIEAAILSEQQLSVIMVDIDHFKLINDTYGHIAGDHVLTVFSELLLRCIRKTDLVARYGGEEFLVVLPSTGTDMAFSIAERIRQTIADAQIPPIDGMNIPSVTCSMGISTYPLHCNNKSDLIKTSDIALYKAKKSGRNCIKVYGQ